jgi:hypothetical protein
MDSSKLLIVGGVVLGGFYLLNKNKKDKENAQILVLQNTQPQTPPVQTTAPAEDLTGFYTPAEATKKALEVVTKWISLLDAIPKEALTQENRNIINRRINAEREKEARIGYDKALAEAKLKNLPKFTFQDTTYWTANEEDERNGSFVTVNPTSTGGKWGGIITNLLGNQWVRNPNNMYYVNTFKDGQGREAILMSALEMARMSNPNDPATLGDYVKYVKTQEFSRIYDILKEVFTTIPKSDVNRLVVLLPKYLMAGNDNFAYFQTEYEKNPFTIEEQLYFKDINIEELLSPRKKPMMPNNVFYGQGIEMIKTPIFATASLIQSAR